MMTFWLKVWTCFWLGFFKPELEKPIYVRAVPHRSSA